MIRMFHVDKIYPNRIVALKDINIHIKKGEFVFLVGPTGAGKSTFLKLIYRGIIPTRGQVIIDGINISRLKPKYIPYLRRNIGIVFQDFKLLYDRTVYENIAFGLKAIGATNFEIRAQVKKVLNLVGLEHKKKAKPHLLSGGEQQKLCIARAIANEPMILLTDEPTGNLDPDTSWEIMQLLFHINIRGTTIVMASHDKLMVDQAKKRIIRLDRGHIIEDNPKGTY
ncbi:MAG: cell division ATP-binding protein FtsE [Candidatus Caldatribacteriota bacterium]